MRVCRVGLSFARVLPRYESVRFAQTAAHAQQRLARPKHAVRTAVEAPAWSSRSFQHIPASSGIQTLEASKSNVGAFIENLNAFAKTQPSPQQVDVVVGMMESVVDNVSVNHLSDWIWSLGALGISMRLPRQQALIRRSLQMLCDAQQVPCGKIASCLDGLSRTGLLLSDLSGGQRSALMSSIDQASVGFNPRSIANILKALGKLGATWTLLPCSTRESLWMSCERNANQFVEAVGAALTLHSFGQLGLDAQSLSEMECKALHQIISKGISMKKAGQSARVISQQNAMAMLGLGKMGVDYSALPKDLVDHMENCLLQSCPDMNEQEVSNVIYAFGLMECPCEIIKPALQTALQQAALAKLPTMSPQAIFLTLYGLALTNVQWGDLNRNLTAGFDQAVTKMVSSQALRNNTTAKVAQAVAMSVYSLGQMGAPWHGFSSSFQRDVPQAFIALQGLFIAQGMSMFIFGLGQMGAPFKHLPTDFGATLKLSVERLMKTPRTTGELQLSSIFLGLAKMDAHWSQLPVETLEAALCQAIPTLSAQEMANIFYSMGNMGLSWSELRLETLRSLAASFEVVAREMTSQGLANSMYGLSVMSFDSFKYRSILDSMKPVEREKLELLWRMFLACVKRFRNLPLANCQPENYTQFCVFFELLSILPGGKEMGYKPIFQPPHRVKSTNTHLATSKALTLALNEVDMGKFRVVNEYAAFSGIFDVDIAVFQGDMLAAFVEVDGFGHYTAGGTQLKRIDLLKQFLCGHRYPGVPVYRISNAKVTAMGEEAVGKELAMQIAGDVQKARAC